MVDINSSGRKKIAEALVRKGLQTVRVAKRNCPVDTGRLRASITVADSEGITQTTSIEPPRATGDNVVVRVGTNVEYAEYVEFGTENQPAKPFLRTAFQQVFGQLPTTDQGDEQ